MAPPQFDLTPVPMHLRPAAAAVLEALAARAPGASICPTDAARRLGGVDFRPHLAAVREAAAMLRAQGVVEV